MLKDLNKEDWIIPPSDHRYGKLGHIWKKYNYNDLIYNVGYHSYQYYIIPELVITEYNKKIKIRKIADITDGSYINWVRGSGFEWYLELTTGLSAEDYFNLLHKSNSRSNYVRCAYCHDRIPFTNFLRGYNSVGRMEGDLIGKRTCSQSCLLSYKYLHENIYGKIGFKNAETNAKTKRKWFLNQGDLSDECYLYITESRGNIKIGITETLEGRKHCYESYESDYSELELLVASNRLDIANIEYIFKSRHNYEEYLNLNKSDVIDEISDISNKYFNNQLTIDFD